MEWLFHILFLTSCRSLVSLAVNPEGLDCQILTPSTDLNMEENSAAYYFSQSEASDDLAIKSLEKELGRDPVFKSIWKEASNSWEGKTDKVPDGLREEHFIALTAYTFGGDLYSSFNDGVRSYGGDLNKYNACFKLKSFHYLLSVALDELKNSSIGPVYRGTWSNISGRMVPGKPGTEMRFGIFASTSFNEVEAEKFGTKPFFVISTSYGVDLRKFSFRPSQEEVLIPPYEKFIIKGVVPLSGGNRYTLESTGYEGMMVGLGSDGSGSLIVYSITPWWVWFLTALGILVILGGGGGLTWYCCNKSSRIPPDQPQTLTPLNPT